MIIMVINCLLSFSVRGPVSEKVSFLLKESVSLITWIKNVKRKRNRSDSLNCRVFQISFVALF